MVTPPRPPGPTPAVTVASSRTNFLTLTTPFFGGREDRSESPAPVAHCPANARTGGDASPKWTRYEVFQRTPENPGRKLSERSQRHGRALRLGSWQDTDLLAGSFGSPGGLGSRQRAAAPSRPSRSTAERHRRSRSPRERERADPRAQRVRQGTCAAKWRGVCCLSCC